MDINLNYGDAVERENIDWIRQTLPEYELLWVRFVGHDGNGRPLDVPLVSLSSNDRERFFQAHYSVLLCILALRDITASYQKRLGQVQTVSDYLTTTRDSVTFMANLGRLRDLFQKMDGALKLGNVVWKQFDDLYSQRNNIMHSPIPAHRLVDGLLQIPIPADRSAGSGWSDEGRWSNADKYAYAFLADFFNNTTNEAIGLTRSGISQCVTRLKELEPNLTKPIQVIYPAPTTTIITQSLSGVNALFSK